MKYINLLRRYNYDEIKKNRTSFPSWYEKIKKYLFSLLSNKSSEISKQAHLI